MRLTDQYVWNIIFSLFFLVLAVVGVVALQSEAARPFTELTLLDYTLMSLATWRLIRLFVYDMVTKFLREQFYNAVEVKGRIVLQKPERGPRRTLADLFGCPWCFGVWAATLVVFGYLMFDWVVYVAIILSIAAVASFLQLLSNLVGHRAEQLKNQNERGY